MMFGLTEADLRFIEGFGKTHPQIRAIGIYGSRARGDFRPTSDVDIILYGADIDCELLEQAEDYLENRSPYPFYVDVQHYEAIQDPVFKEQVDRTVRVVYSADS